MTQLYIDWLHTPVTLFFNCEIIQCHISCSLRVQSIARRLMDNHSFYLLLRRSTTKDTKWTALALVCVFVISWPHSCNHILLINYYPYHYGNYTNTSITTIITSTATAATNATTNRCCWTTSMTTTTTRMSCGSVFPVMKEVALVWFITGHIIMTDSCKPSTQRIS